MTAIEFLLKHTNGVYSDLTNFNHAYTLRGLILKSISNIRDNDKEVDNFIVSNNLVGFSCVNILPDRITIHKEGLDMALTYDFEFLDRFCFDKPIKEYKPSDCIVDLSDDDFWDSI